jgi:hypothetical protein
VHVFEKNKLKGCKIFATKITRRRGTRGKKHAKNSVQQERVKSSQLNSAPKL